MNFASAASTVSLIVNAPAAPSKLAILSPAGGSTLSGSVVVTGRCGLALDPAGTYLMVDGGEWGTRSVTEGPFRYPLDTTLLAKGPHTLQLWDHDIGKNVTLSAPIITIRN